MTAAPDPTTNIAVEIAQLRGEIHTGLEQIKGTLGVLVERTDRNTADVRQLRADTDAHVRQLRADMEGELQKIRDEEVRPLRAKVEALEERRFPLPVLGALATIGALLASVIGLIVTR
ncbi:hypothetical protein [Streptomyces sp. JB150]|uniref:hypothetical protein n=1 Tax=Streptomyces sp. JB150 TaxID=2714844 RepID=UPI00140C5A1B|nr:hypothetical protein [Streptomyces sp. JB150]QIJ62541.1 hypothetical protein G7Z13_11200 [Streptomyces sp. JB150]